MTNILSFSLVKSEYDITYDGDAFIIHRAAKGYSDMVFKPHKSSLHVYDPDDPRGLASHCFMETVESNMSLFTSRADPGCESCPQPPSRLGVPVQCRHEVGDPV
jgi:hypothetical protein